MWWWAPTGCTPGSAPGSPAATLSRSTRTPRDSAASFRPCACRACPTPARCSSGMGPGAHLLHYPIAGGRLINFLAVIEGPARWTAPAWMETAAPGAHLCGLHRLASGRRPNAHSCAPVAALGTVHPPPADPLEPRPGGAARRRCPCHAPAPGPGSQPGDRGRRRPGPPNWTAPPTSPPPCAATTTGGGSAPARFKPPLRPPLRRCTCPTGPPPGNAAPTSPGYPNGWPGSTATTSSPKLPFSPDRRAQRTARLRPALHNTPVAVRQTTRSALSCRRTWVNGSAP